MLDRPDFQATLRRAFAEKIPFCRMLGLSVEVVQGGAQISFAKQDFMVGNTKVNMLHGGVTAAVLDTVGGVAVFLKMTELDPKPDVATQMREFARLSTIDLRIDYLEPAAAERFVATANVTRVGRRIANAQMALHDDAGRCIATGAGAFSLRTARVQ